MFIFHLLMHLSAGAVLVFGFMTTYAIGAYPHWSCEFEFLSSEMYLIHYVIVYDRLVVFSTNKTDCNNITELFISYL